MRKPIFVQPTFYLLITVMLIGTHVPPSVAQKPRRPQRVKTPPPTLPPLETVDMKRLANSPQRLDLFLLIGQSNMKGRGFMPAKPSRDPRVVMMHMKEDSWFVARHPVHLTGESKTFAGANNAGVGPGLAFAKKMLEMNDDRAIGLIPNAVGGSSIAQWSKGQAFYNNTIRRAKLALENTAPAGRLSGMLWLQGESDTKQERLKVYEQKLLQLVDDLRADLSQPELPFIACTIGEIGKPARIAGKKAINEILLSLPTKRPNTGCVDARDLKTHIGDEVHFDTAAQNEIGHRFANVISSLNAPVELKPSED